MPQLCNGHCTCASSLVFSVIGALIGKQEGRNIEVMNSFELLSHTIDDRVHIDKEYYYTKEEQCECIAPLPVARDGVSTVCFFIMINVFPYSLKSNRCSKTWSSWAGTPQAVLPTSPTFTSTSRSATIAPNEHTMTLVHLIVGLHTNNCLSQSLSSGISHQHRFHNSCRWCLFRGGGGINPI